MIAYDIFKKKIFFLFITWASFFFSLGLNPLEFFDYNLVAQIRLISPFILSFILILFFFNKIKFSKLLKIPNIFFLVIFFSYTYFNLNNSLNNDLNISWSIYMFLSLFIMQSFTNYHEKILLLKLSIVILFFVLIFFFFASTLEAILYKDHIHFYGILGRRLTYAGLENVPRSSGLARLSLVMFTLLTLFYIYEKKIKNYKILFSILLFSLITLIFHSRTISFIYLIINSIIIIFYYKKFFFDKLIIFFAFIFPIIINFFYSIHIAKIQNLEHVDGSNVFSLAQNSIIRSSDYEKYSHKGKRIERYSSGRFNNWKYAYYIIKKKPLKGYGPQADRILINNQSIHNGFLYTMLSGGLIAGISVILIYIYSIWLLLKYYFLNRNSLNKNYITSFCSFLIIIFGLRSTLETSFAIFSIDFLLFILALSIIRDHLLNNEK